MIGSTVPAALDPNLAKLIDQESQGLRLPLPIERFKEYTGASCVVDAIATAVKKLLDSYLEARPGRVGGLPISVSDLCEIAGIDLVGLPLTTTSKTSTYGLNTSAPRQTGHTGVLRLGRARPVIKIPLGVDRGQARVSAAHEIGHFLVHNRGNGLDLATVKMGSSPEEEAIVEYASRLLLMPGFREVPKPQPDEVSMEQLPLIADERLRPAPRKILTQNLAKDSIVEAQHAEVTIHSAVARLGDPDRRSGGIRCAVLWRMAPRAASDAPIWQRLTPQWHLSNAFIPIGRCGARNGSLIADLAEKDIPTQGSRIEDVSIGSLVGSYKVDAFAWGTLASGTRLVLSIFVDAVDAV